jgi:cob(I)alamin adenosyltransferase
MLYTGKGDDGTTGLFGTEKMSEKLKTGEQSPF